MTTVPTPVRWVVRLPNWVGDVCMALPAITALAQEGPTVVVGRGWAQDLLAGMPWPVEPLPRSLWAAGRCLRAWRGTEGLLFTNSLRSALEARLGGLRAWGYRGHGRTWLLAHAVARPDGGHEVAVFWQLACAARGIIGGAPPPELGLALHARHRSEAAQALAQAGVTGPYTVICPLAQGMTEGQPKLWPAFPLLCRGLLEAGQTLVACPGPGEAAACAAASPGVHQLTGLRLGAYAAVLAGATSAIANDSGPMHLAAAVGTPVLGIFGVSDALRTRPWTARGATVGSSAGWPTVQEVVEAWHRLRGSSDR